MIRTVLHIVFIAEQSQRDITRVEIIRFVRLFLIGIFLESLFPSLHHIGRISEVSTKRQREITPEVLGIGNISVRTEAHHTTHITVRLFHQSHIVGHHRALLEDVVTAVAEEIDRKVHPLPEELRIDTEIQLGGLFPLKVIGTDGRLRHTFGTVPPR